MKYRMLMIASMVGFLAGCPDDNNDYSYTVTVENVTANQPMSPLALMVHDESFALFRVGEPASVALENLAESGSNSDLLSLQNSGDDISFAVSGNGLILPGASDAISFTLSSDELGYLSLASMLVNTNDAFVGETGLDLGSLAVGERFEMAMNVWDAGTEADDESAASIPGPAAGGEGFNPTRDDVDRVSFHAGVITADDGLSGSALDATHRFASPAALLTIIRTE